MKPLGTTLKHHAQIALLGGLLVLAPVAIAAQTLLGIRESLDDLVGPILEVLPGAELSLGGLTLWRLAVIVLLILICYGLGQLVLRTRVGKAVRAWFERNLISRTYFFEAYQRAIGDEAVEERKSPAMIRYGGVYRPGVVVESAGGWDTVVIPIVPKLDELIVACVPNSSVRLLDVPFDEFHDQLEKLGRGAPAWLEAVRD